jgi:UDP-3-O-[3-hydroxymyristoyl] glucosamine N-acyltransferase
VTEPAGSPHPAEGPALTAAEIAGIVGGALIGEGSRLVRSVAPLIRAGPDELSFLADKRYAPLLAETKAGVVLVAPEYADAAGGGEQSRIVVARPHDALVALLPRFARHVTRSTGIAPTAVIGRNAQLGRDVTIDAHAVVGDGASLADGVWIGPHCVVGDGVSIGPDTRLLSHVTCYPGSIIGARVTIHAGARIGSDGFGYVFAAGAHQKITHVGRCIIHDDVEIGANTCIDRGSVDDTVIGAGTKIDNLVHVAHNVHIGRLCLLIAQVGIAGSTHVEDGAVLGGQAGITGHVTIGAQARVAAQAGVITDVPAGETWSGYPARPHKESLRASAALFRLSSIIKRLERMVSDQE